jgi:hypothetical protein
MGMRCRLHKKIIPLIFVFFSENFLNILQLFKGRTPLSIAAQPVITRLEIVEKT